MKNGLNKFAKGMFAIFTIKLLFFGIMFINQSCQTEDDIFENQEQKIALQKFENLFLEIQPKIENTFDKQNLLLSKKSYVLDKQTVEKSKEILTPLVKGSKELLKSYGINESDFLEEFADLNDPRIAFVGLMILSADKKKEKDNLASINYASFFVASAYATNMDMEPDWYDCMLRSVGIDAVVELFNGKVTKAIAKKAIRKIASRTLGWVGAAIAVYEFGDCMDWY